MGLHFNSDSNPISRSRFRCNFADQPNFSDWLVSFLLHAHNTFFRNCTYESGTWQCCVGLTIDCSDKFRWDCDRPFTLVFLVGPVLQSIGPVELSAGDLLLKLCVSILLPLSLGRFCRKYGKHWLDGHRSQLVVISNLALISVPWMKFSQSSERLAEVDMNELLVLIVACMFLHIVYLILNTGVVKLLSIDWNEGKAVILLSSQKTIPVAMAVLAFVPVAEETKGLIAIPCITFHFVQIIIDALLVTRWANRSTA